VLGRVEVVTKRDDLAAIVERPEVELLVAEDLPRRLHLEFDDNLSTDLVAARKEAADLEVPNLDRCERSRCCPEDTTRLTSWTTVQQTSGQGSKLALSAGSVNERDLRSVGPAPKGRADVHARTSTHSPLAGPFTK
jgi:hypothetical protein